MERNDTGLDANGLGDANEFSGSATPSRDTASASDTGSTATAGYTGLDDVSTTGSTGVKAKIGAAREKVMDSMGAAKDWVKEKDIDALKAGIEAQVKEHPGRTLLVAVGLGYLIGRAFRGKSA
jgi:ElaB/YqjD/DUF883 family membrane-anchored ribosome-binding protein